MPTADATRTEQRDYYEVLGTGPGATTAELRTAFREAVLRHHPDRAATGDVATRRTSILNRAWAELRDPVRRMHYDNDLEAGRHATLAWPLDEGESPRVARGRPARTERPGEPSPWHQPQWRSVAGFRVPAKVFMDGPAAQDRWIVENHIAGEDWRTHDERYWLRYAARHYAERGRNADWLGALERIVELRAPLSEVAEAGLREAYVASGEELRGAMAFGSIAGAQPAGSASRAWAERELRALLAEYRDRHVRRGRVAERAENAELLLNFLEVIGIEPSFADYRAAIVAHRRAGHAGRAAELVDRVLSAPVVEPGQWFSRVQLLTEAGQLDRASLLLAELARGARPDALDPKRVHGPWRRIASARSRLAAARRRARAKRPTDGDA
jgi:curved DNA-binding protein CbpA